MSVAGNGSRRYEVHCSDFMGKVIRRVHRRGSQQGRGQAVTRALRQIIRRLEIDPFSVGEPSYRLPGLHMQVQTTVIRPLVVDFGICEDRPIVFIKGVRLLSAS